MRFHIPNSAFLGNINTFISSFDPSNPNELYISANPKWFSIHPVVISMIASAGANLEPRSIHCQELTSVSKHYLKRLGLLDFLGIDSKIDILEHESAGRFIPLTQIHTFDELSSFIKMLFHCCILSPFMQNL